MSRVLIRTPTTTDQAEFLALAMSSRSFHSPWVTAPSSAAEFHAYISRMSQAENRAFLVCSRSTGNILGVINITNIVFGAFRSAYLGYYVFAGNERQGFMREGLRSVIKHAFASIRLHRLEANIQPANAASIGLVQSCGFSREGYSPRYLKIGSRWRDHERWAMLSS